MIEALVRPESASPSPVRSGGTVRGRPWLITGLGLVALLLAVACGKEAGDPLPTVAVTTGFDI